MDYLTRNQKMELSLKLKKAQEIIMTQDEERKTFIHDYSDLERFRNILLLRKDVTCKEGESILGIMKWILSGPKEMEEEHD
ncbi:hypothetical protein NDK25_22155 [Niallia taxi]|nr:hypothetical protein [Niallia taxi]MDE5054922.1 hypothetical protein [Niallia taxi]